MEFYRLRTDIHLNAKKFCKAVHNRAFEYYREPTGIDVEMIIPELEKMRDRLSHCITYYDFMASHEIVEAIKDAHMLKGLYVIFPYGTYNYDFVIKKAYQSKDLFKHLCYCYNRICEYEAYLTGDRVAA